MSFDASLLVMMGLFWVTYLILRRFFFKPMMQLLEKRSSTIESAQTAFDGASEETRQKLETERGRMNNARVEAMATREQDRREAQARRAQQLADAKARVQKTLDDAAKELESNVDEQRASLEGEAQRLADRIATSLLGRTA